jgi:hypothetical protein
MGLYFRGVANPIHQEIPTVPRVYTSANKDRRRGRVINLTKGLNFGL